MAAALLALLAALLAAAAAAAASEAAALAPEAAAAAFVASVLFWAGWHAVTPMAETAAPAIMILRSVLEVMVLVPLGEIVSATVFADGVPVCTTPLAHQRLSSNGAAPPSFQAFGTSELPDPARSNVRFGSSADLRSLPGSGPSEGPLRGVRRHSPLTALVIMKVGTNARAELSPCFGAPGVRVSCPRSW